jgi:hypothetical protein
LLGFTLSWVSCDSASESDSTARADTLVTFQDAHHFIDFDTGENRRSISQTFVFPADLDRYARIEAVISLTCPQGGCDPWDRFAALSIVRETDEIEIARYITPYGIGCSWTVDVTDYRSYLEGSVQLSSFIDTWVSTGWLMTTRFVMTEGEPEFTDIEVTNIWRDWDVVYGDPTRPPLQPSYTTAPGLPTTARVVARIVNTGHGQGNTGNAAEFLPASHGVYLDGALEHSQSLWRNDCAQNRCSPQQGNWQNPRAGWCPGAAVAPVDVDLTAAIAGEEKEIEYRLAEYENLCRPDNPTCASETSCQSCEYDGGAHTEPHYKISFQLLTYHGGEDG